MRNDDIVTAHLEQLSDALHGLGVDLGLLHGETDPEEASKMTSCAMSTCLLAMDTLRRLQRALAPVSSHELRAPGKACN